jgi:hypothetical protein
MMNSNHPEWLKALVTLGALSPDEAQQVAKAAPPKGRP